MAKLEAAIREAIARGARRQVRLATLPIRREVAKLRRRVAQDHAILTTLSRSAAALERRMDGSPSPPVSEAEVTSARLSPRLVQSLRRRLGLSQMGLGRLVGVSAPAVAHWEAGNTAPQGRNRAVLVGLRKVGKREARALLAQRTKTSVPRRRAMAARPHQRRTRARRRPRG